MTLDAWFAHAQREEDPSTWQAKAIQDGPSAWRSRRNPITLRLAETLEQDTGIDIGTPAGKELWSIAAQLLIMYNGDIELLTAALERCRRDPRWQTLSPWVQRKVIGLEASRLLTRRKRGNDVASGFYGEDVPEWA